jgi:hypothetical protein
MATSPMQTPFTDAGLTVTELRARIIDAQDFHVRFRESTQCDSRGLQVRNAPAWAEKLIRRSANTAQAVLAKLGSNIIAKRRPEETQAFLDYVTRRLEAKSPLVLRVVFGPVKNVQRYGDYQSADMAEYLTLMQLARLAETMAAIYPHGVRVEIVPDDKRGGIANGWPQAYSGQYIASLQCMVKDLQFDSWMIVEDGQARLYAQYGVDAHTHAATLEVMADAQFVAKLERACDHARENLFSQEKNLSELDVRDSAMRYLVAHKAEMLSGMWSPIDALPLVFANHPDNFQLYTMGRGLTKLPWQVCLPFAALRAQEYSLAPLPAMQFSHAS